MRLAKALIRLRICAGRSEALLIVENLMSQELADLGLLQV